MESRIIDAIEALDYSQLKDLMDEAGLEVYADDDQQSLAMAVIQGVIDGQVDTSALD